MKFLINAVIHKPVAHGLASPSASWKQERCTLNIFHALSGLFSFPSSAIILRKERRGKEEEKIEGGKATVGVSLSLDLHKIIESSSWRELEMSPFCQQHLYTQAHTIKSLLVCALLMKKSSLTLLPMTFPCESIEEVFLWTFLSQGPWQLCGPHSKAVPGSQMRRTKII